MRLAPDAAGLHLVGWLPHGVSDVSVARAAALGGVEVTPLSRYSSSAPRRAALLLGYAAFAREEIRMAVQKLSKVLATG